jgi:hypothetical protein
MCKPLLPYPFKGINEYIKLLILSVLYYLMPRPVCEAFFVWIAFFCSRRKPTTSNAYFLKASPARSNTCDNFFSLLVIWGCHN